MAATTTRNAFSEQDVEELLSWEELLAAMEAALREFSGGRVLQPVRTALELPDPACLNPAWFAAMPCVYGDVMGAKLVTVFPENEKRGMATHQATIHLFSRHTGEPLCTMDGRLITARRTAAVSALATRELARPEAEVLAILGSGVQARTHWHALRMVRHFKEVRVWSRTPEHARRFAQETGAAISTSAEGAVRDADVVVTVTHAIEPVLKGEWLKSGVHVNAVGSVGMKARELDDEAMRSAAVIVESREAAQRESAEIVQSGSEVYAELGEILAGTKPKPEGKTVYKSLGMAVEDIAAARLVFEKARRR